MCRCFIEHKEKGLANFLKKGLKKSLKCLTFFVFSPLLSSQARQSHLKFLSCQQCRHRLATATSMWQLVFCRHFLRGRNWIRTTTTTRVNYISTFLQASHFAVCRSRCGSAGGLCMNAHGPTTTETLLVYLVNSLTADALASLKLAVAISNAATVKLLRLLSFSIVVCSHGT